MNSRDRLVGRDDAFRATQTLLRGLAAGNGELLLITGEAGSGKSAMLVEVSRQAIGSHARVLRGACWDGVGTPPYWPWTQVLRGAEPSLPVGALGSAARLLSGQPTKPPGSAAESTDAQFRLFDDVASALRRLAESGPLVVLLDDLQWADVSSLRLLEFVRAQLSAEPVLLVGAYRDTEAAEELRRVGGQLLPLVPIGTADVADLVTVVAGSRPSMEQADAVRRRCGGNPFFVRELTRLMLARGGWAQLDGGESPALPDGVRATLTARLDRLSAPTRDLLAVMAVLDRDVGGGVLSRLVGDGTPESISDVLDEAVRARVVSGDDTGSPRIAHDLFRDAVLSRVPPRRRAQLHGEVGRALLDLYGGPTARDLYPAGAAARLAAHFLAAGSDCAVEARTYSVLAAEDASARLGHEDAVRHYENALQLRGALEPDADLLLALAVSEDRAGDGVGARETYGRVAELAQATFDPALLARAAIGMHSLGDRVGADTGEVFELLTEAAAATSGQVDAFTASPAGADLRSRVLAALARQYRHSAAAGLDPAAVLAADEAVVLARVAGDPATQAVALLASHDVAWQPGSARERLRLASTMADLAHDAADPELQAEATLLRASALVELGDPVGRAELTAYTTLAGNLGDARGRWGRLSRRATLAEMAGRLDEAIALADQALELGRAVGIPDAAGCHATLRGSLAALGAAMPPLDQLLPDLDPLWPLFPLLSAWSDIYVGELSRARATMQGFAVRDLSGRYDLEMLAAAAVVCAAVGTVDQQRWLYDQLAPHAGLHVVVGGCAAYHGAVDDHLGRLAAALGQPDRAAQHFSAAMAQHDRLGTPAWGEVSRRARDRLVAGGVFRPDGETWQLTFDSVEARLPDARGLHDIATLLGAPNQDIHVFTLLGLPNPGLGADPPVLDERARAEFAARLRVLDIDIAEADATADPERSARADAERRALLQELSAATGLGGRKRRLGAETERARKAVGARIRDVLLRVDRVHPTLARHLRDTIVTGTTCSYHPHRARPGSCDHAWLSTLLFEYLVRS